MESMFNKPLPEAGMLVFWYEPDDNYPPFDKVAKYFLLKYGRLELRVAEVFTAELVTLTSAGNVICDETGRPKRFNWFHLCPFLSFSMRQVSQRDIPF